MWKFCLTPFYTAIFRKQYLRLSLCNTGKYAGVSFFTTKE